MIASRFALALYKVPSLRGVWFRNVFGHAGQAETLKEWLDPPRLKNDYVPKGFQLGPGPIKGHVGFTLSPDDWQPLIAFLKTLYVVTAVELIRCIVNAGLVGFHLRLCRK
ncbi:MAG: hypothetical protein WA869_34510 [Alloacidobacterium sp.]